ncbi:MAG: hypothetical protein PHS93_08470 [Candidatus Omnitrophica bacterium]|nr:hypothetical protein [Candidatus Omnitrophota bacterium]
MNNAKIYHGGGMGNSGRGGFSSSFSYPHGFIDASGPSPITIDLSENDHFRCDLAPGNTHFNAPINGLDGMNFYLFLEHTDPCTLSWDASFLFTREEDPAAPGTFRVMYPVLNPIDYEFTVLKFFIYGAFFVFMGQFPVFTTRVYDESGFEAIRAFDQKINIFAEEMHARSNLDYYLAGDYNQYVSGASNEFITGNKNIDGDENINVSADSSISISARYDLNLATTLGDIDIGSGGAMSIYTSAGDLHIDAIGGGIKSNTIKSGATQAAAGAAAGELWKTSGHASLPDNVIMHGV